MKKLTCEMCGSTDLIKQDGVFVCQVCGCKYSIEDAKKMMVEGTVEVAGTVKVDQSEDLRKLYEIARRAKQENNSENAHKYYEQILMKDPGSWEANFYTVYYQSMNCKIGEIGNAAVRLTNSEDTVLKLIKENNDSPEDKKVAIDEVAERLVVIARMLFGAYKSHYDGISSNIKSSYTQEYINTCMNCRDILYTYGNQVYSIFGNDFVSQKVLSCWKVGVELHKILMPVLAQKDLNNQIISKYEDIIQTRDNSYLTTRDKLYQELIAKIDDGSSKSKYYADILKELKQYSDYADYEEHRKECDELYNKAVEKEQKKNQKAMKWLGIAAAIIAVLFVIITSIVNKTHANTIQNATTDLIGQTYNGKVTASKLTSSRSSDYEMTITFVDESSCTVYITETLYTGRAETFRYDEDYSFRIKDGEIILSWDSDNSSVYSSFANFAAVLNDDGKIYYFQSTAAFGKSFYNLKLRLDK